MEQYEEIEDLVSFFSIDEARKRVQVAEEQIKVFEEHKRLAEEQIEVFKERKRFAEEQVEEFEKRERRTQELSVLVLISQGDNIDRITRILKVTVEDIEAIQEKYKDNNPVTEFLKRRSKN